jgi:hypothetical protein
MAVMMPREKWTDERLDDLNKKVDDGFARLDGNIMELRREINARFDSMDARFDALNRNLFWGMVTVIVALLGSNAF